MRFEYLEPESLEDAIGILGQYGGRARVLAGGTDLIVQIRDHIINPDYLIDISHLENLAGVYADETGLRIGAATTIREIEMSTEVRRHYPVLAQAAGRLGSVAIRNVATIGGNICNASPSAEMAPALIGLGASVKIACAGGAERAVSAEDFFIGPGKSSCTKGEIVTEIFLPVPPLNTRGVYLKHARTFVDLAIASAAVVLTADKPGTCTEAKIVLGAVAPTPVRIKRAEELLRGNKLTETVIREAAGLASSQATPITDVRSTAEYRREMVSVLVRQALSQAIG